MRASEWCDSWKLPHGVRPRPGSGFVTTCSGFTRKTFTAMVEGVGDRALASGLVDEDTWRRGIQDLHRTTEVDGTFCYTFFKAVARKP